MLRALALTALAALAGCTPPVGAFDRDVVSGFQVSPTFNAFTQPCAIRYRLAEPAYVEIRVTQTQPDGTTALVRQITDRRRETAGARSAAWRGVGPSGLFAPQGAYTVEIRAALTPDADRAESWALSTIMFRS